MVSTVASHPFELMMRTTSRTVWLSLLAPMFSAMLMGASCSGGEGQGTPSSSTSHGTETPTPPAASRIAHIEGVDISELTQAERRIFVDVVNDQTSPCGEPTSVARCAQETHSCRACVPAARYVVRLISEGFERSEIEELYTMRFGRDSRLDIDIEGHALRGTPMAPITIALFSDFQCPYCGEAHPLVQQALREFEGNVRVVFFQYPLEGHPRAMPAARAAVAAQNQGKFWEMHDMLFEHQTALEDADLERYARVIGLDMERFAADLTSAETQRRIDADRELGHRLEVRGTPSLFVNGRRFRANPHSLSAYLREELEQ